MARPLSASPRQRRPGDLVRAGNRAPTATDGKIVHLDGLNFSRAWCLRSLARAFDAHDPRRALFLETAETHLQSSIAHVADHYMGEHWLATYATMALVPPI